MMDLGIHSFWEFLIGTIIIVLLPGPNSLYVITAAARHGHAGGWLAAWGIFTGDTILMVATASGAASLMVLFPTAFLAVKAVGAVYLGWIGLQLMREALSRWRGSVELDEDVVLAETEGDAHQILATSNPAMDPPHPYWRALTLSLTNPKAILFFLAFFTQFVRSDAPSVVLAYFSLGVVVQICSLLYLWMLIVAGVGLRRQFEDHPRWAATGMGIVGVFFLGFAVKMLVG
jgi:leucine efflux protein